MIRRLFDKLNIIIKVSFLHSLLIAKRGGCGLIELAQCLRRGVAEPGYAFCLHRVSRVADIIRTMKLCFFPYVEGWAPCCSVDDKGESACNSSSIRGKDDFFKSEIWKKKFPIRSKTKDSKTNSSWDISEENAEFFFQSGSSRWQISLKERVVKKEWKIETKGWQGKGIEFEGDFH